MNNSNLLKLTFMVTALLFFASCGGENSKKETNSVAKVADKNVKVESVVLEPVEQNVVFTATVEANTVNNIVPAIGGRIRNIMVDVGSTVSKGQTVVVMDGTTYSQQEIQIAALKRDYQRYKELYEVGGISKQQLEQMKTQLYVSQTALDNLQENTRLVSPISGVVTARNFDAGDVAAGAPILTIANINPVKVLVNVSESYYSKVSKGMKVKVEVDALKDEPFEGVVSLIHPTLNAVAHTFPVEIELKNPNGKIKPGMFSRVKMGFGEAIHALVPDMAVLKQTGSNQRYVFVEKNGVAVYTIVELGARINNKYEIVSGLYDGDKVIVSGNTSLIDGTKVNVIE